jgi:hypothetical protein
LKWYKLQDLSAIDTFGDKPRDSAIKSRQASAVAERQSEQMRVGNLMASRNSIQAQPLFIKERTTIGPEGVTG